MLMDWFELDYYLKQYPFISKTVQNRHNISKRLFDNIEMHHFNPLSTWWIDKACNKWDVYKVLHLYIHEVLNIPRNTHFAKTRFIRKISNHKLNKSVEEVKLLNELSNMYFAWLPRLTPELINIHEIKMFETLQYRQNIANTMKIDHDRQKYISSFNQMKASCDNIQIKIATEIEKTLRNKYQKR